jgi:hypothetical protein
VGAASDHVCHLPDPRLPPHPGSVPHPRQATLATTRSLRALRAAASMLLLGSVTGCGFILTQGPPEGHAQMDYFSCTESNAGPIIDIVWGGLNVLGALVVAADPGDYRDSDAAIVGGLLWGALSGSAAAVGFGKTRRCRSAKQQLAQRLGPNAPPGPSTGPSGGRPVQAVVVEPARRTLAVGERVQLVATAHDSSGRTVDDRSFVWSSSNDAIASVGAAGLVTANAPGSAVIAARSGDALGTASIDVVLRE